MKWGLPIGLTLLFWSLIGVIRYVEETILKRRKKREVIVFHDKKVYRRRLRKVAICIAARNEEHGIQKTLNSVKRLVPLENIYLVSDGSTDSTAKIATRNAVNVLTNDEGHGKAGALKMLIEKFNLLERYKFILFVDADTRINSDYLRNALVIFDDPRISCIAGYAKNQWRNGMPIDWKYFLIAYRTRLYSVLQFFLSYGQTWTTLNVISIVPGFASMYRTSILKQLELNTPGIIIEDFNLTFQLRKKRLGIVYHHPSMFGIAQDPTNLRDYIKQVSRWNLGFFQTVRHYGVWFSFFWASLSLYIIEGFISAIYFFMIPLLLSFLILIMLEPVLNVWFLNPTQDLIDFYIIYLEIVIGILVADYLLTIFIAIKDKKPMLAFYGLGFPFIRYIDGAVLLFTAPKAFFVRSLGQWTSPDRK